MIDFAARAYNHSFHIDPIVRFFSDTDMYKLLMLQKIWSDHLDDEVSFSLTNRTKTVLLADDVDLDELRAQLDHVRTLKWTRKEINFLKAQEFYGQRNLFSDGFLEFLQHNFKLSDYTLRLEHDEVEHLLAGVGSRPADYKQKRLTGQISLTFHGKWVETTMWEIYALTIVNEMRYRRIMSKMSKLDLDIMYSQAKVKLYRKLTLLQGVADLNLTDFGTRRRHSFLWQEYAVQMAVRVLGDNFTGTSNVYLAMEYGLDAKGTNAHEIPMAIAAMTKDDRALKESQYRACQQWQNHYRGGLLVMLPDTFGTTQFLRDAPQWLATWRGARPDSKNPFEAGDELIEWWKENGQNPKEKLIIFSDGLDVHLRDFEPQGQDIIALQDAFRGRVQTGFGFGTNFTNDFMGCHPDDPSVMKPISLVCKVSEANGQPAVKLSDNYDKATSSAPDVLARYRRVFGSDGMKNVPVHV